MLIEGAIVILLLQICQNGNMMSLLFLLDELMLLTGETNSAIQEAENIIGLKVPLVEIVFCYAVELKRHFS